MLAWAAWSALWSLGHKVVFDGENRLIIIPADVNVLNFKNDIYSSWKEWTTLYDHAEFLQAIRTTGGDPIGGGQYTGDYYFLINGWRIVLQGALQLEGNVFSDDYDSPFTTIGDTALVQNKVSALAIQIDTGTGGTGSPATGSCPTAAEIVAEMDMNSMMLAQIEANTAATYTDTQQILTDIDALTTTVNTINATTQSIQTDVDNIDLTTQNIQTDVNNIDATTLATQTTVNTINSNVLDIQGTVNDIETAITTGAFPTLGSIVDGVWNAALASYTTSGSAGLIVSTILSSVVTTETKSYEIKTVVDSLLIMIDELLKYDRNRTRIDKTAKTLTVYDDDGVTPIRVFNLLDGAGAPSVAEVCERDPGVTPPASHPVVFSDAFGAEFE